MIVSIRILFGKCAVDRSISYGLLGVRERPGSWCWFQSWISIIQEWNCWGELKERRWRRERGWHRKGWWRHTTVFGSHRQVCQNRAEMLKVYCKLLFWNCVSWDYVPFILSHPLWPFRLLIYPCAFFEYELRGACGVCPFLCVWAGVCQDSEGRLCVSHLQSLMLCALVMMLRGQRQSWKCPPPSDFQNESWELLHLS
jgi:hypothetical protein